MAEMIALWREELNRKRDRVLSIEKISLLSDRGIISRKNIAQYMKDADSHGLCGSFRKLEVDWNKANVGNVSILIYFFEHEDFRYGSSIIQIFMFSSIESEIS